MNKIKKMLKDNKFFYSIYNIFFSFILNICKIFIKVDDKIILFNCFGGKKFDDSPRAIYEYILKNEKYNGFKIYWAFDDVSKYDLPLGMKVKNNSIKFFITALRAKYWITNSSMERGLKFKNKATFYINTWHGTTIKKLENDQKDKAFCFNVSKPDVYLAQSRYDVEIFSSAFDVNKNKIVLSGLPRNDELVDFASKNEIDRIKKKLKISDEKKVLLYMPTYREFDVNKNGNYIKPPIDINKWKKMLSDDFVLLFRAHYENNKVLGLHFDDFVCDVSDYEPLNDLLKIADILISDYSSVMFDYSILERPIFSFAYDYESYTEKRGCYIDITKELPNGICKTEDDLLDKIINCNYEKEAVKTRRFKNKFIEVCGNSFEYIDRVVLRETMSPMGTGQFGSGKVSVIIPMYNSEKYIRECLNSVINQTYRNLEIIVVDDCSTDSSGDIVNEIKKYNADDRIKLIRFDKNKGVSSARNKGIEVSIGDYIAFIDSDDVWVEDKIEKQIRFIEKNDYAFIYSDYAFLTERLLGKLSHLNLKLEDIRYKKKALKELKIARVPAKLSYNQAIKNTTIFVSTVMLNMKKLKKEDVYMPDLKIGQDTATWWQILKKGVFAYGMNDVLAYYRVHNNSLSSNKVNAVVGAWRIYCREEKDYLRRIFCFSCYLKNAFLRRFL